MANNNVEIPPYVAFYKMNRDPFSPEVEADIYYAEPTRKQRLDVMLHLAEYGNEIMIVIGPKGSGKTALLQQFIKNKLGNWVIATVTAQEGFDERKFLQHLYRQMNLKFRGPSYNELLDYIQKHFRHLHENAQTPIILIDNAEQLPVTALKKVLEIASLTNDDNKPLIRVIMFGTENIKEHFKQPQLGHLVNLPMRSLELPPLTEEQTAHYILHRTLAAKFTGKDIFNDATLIKVYRESYGWPARINEVCREILLSSLPTKQQDTLPEMESKGRNPKQLVVVFTVIVLIAIAAVIASQGNVNSLMDKSRAFFAGLTTKQKTSMPDSHSEKTQAMQSNLATSSAPKPQPEPESLAEKLRKRDTTYQETTKDGQTIETTMAKNKMPAPPVTKPIATPMPELAILKLQHGNNWILGQNPGHYTLQVVAGQSIKTIEEFLEEHQVKDNVSLYENVALYRSVRKDKPWYGLIIGNYENKAQAVSAVSQLPKKIQREKPWVRDIKGIQNDIRKAQPAALSVTQPVTQNIQPTLTERLSRPAPVAATAPVAPVIEISRREEWILRQRDRHNTLQLMADGNLDTITRFVNRHQIKDSIALYQTTQNGKPWYVLIYGIYPSTDLATTAISQLPPYLQELKPTIRQYSDIHQEIRKTQAGN